jgi:ABC-type dipeptide/oligopeptide/nickel transport system permease component
LWRQFTRYLIGDWQNGAFVCGALCGNLGPSTQQRGRSVQDILFEPPENQTFWASRFGYSLRLVAFASLLATGLGIGLGLVIALKPRSALAHAISISLAALISIPNFVLGLLTIIGLAVGLKVINVLPDWNYPSSWIVPALVLATMPAASLARVTRAALLDIMGQDYIRTARGKGLPETSVVSVHVMRNALAPIITFLGPMVMEMFTGLLIVENLYAFPGFGREYWTAVLKLDYPVVLGLTLLYALGIMLINTLVDVLCEMLDPRLRAIPHGGA